MSTAGGRDSIRTRPASGLWFVARLLVVLALGIVLVTFDPAGHSNSVASATAPASITATSPEHHCVPAVADLTTGGTSDPVPALRAMSLATPVTGEDQHDAAVGACLTMTLAALLAARKMLRPAARPGDHPSAVVDAPRRAAAPTRPSPRQSPARSPALRI